jgi:mannose-6-phosphate isomerase-like protein (cupin superfamily)
MSDKRERSRDAAGSRAHHRPTGQSLIVPAGRKHGFRNSGNAPLHIHAVLASAIFEATPEGATEAVRRWNFSA